MQGASTKLITELVLDSRCDDRHGDWVTRNTELLATPVISHEDTRAVEKAGRESAADSHNALWRLKDEMSQYSPLLRHR